MKIRLYSLIIMFSLIIISCSNIDTSNETAVNQDSQETIIPGLSIATLTSAETTSEGLSTYPIESLSIDMSFFETTEGINDVLGISMEGVINDNPGMSQYSFEQSGHLVVYAQDYQTLLSTMTAEDPITGELYFYASEYDYHRLRRLKIDQISINEYDSSFWAEYEYRSNTDAAIDNCLEVSDSSHFDGYCFIYDTTSHHSMFYATYLVGNYTINYAYSFSRDNSNEYRDYLNFCDILGLPTSNQMTEIILG